MLISRESWVSANNMHDYCVTLAPNCSAKGKVEYAVGSEVPVSVFLGVPYAQPPVGELRFSPPKPAEIWTGERDCTKFGAIPMQPREFSKMVHKVFRDFPEVMSEDCLFLNVYVPNLSRDSQLPVMVWFYGGGFVIGGSDGYQGTALAAYNDVIVVTVNYRLGAFGFFTTGDADIPGNNGLLDQVEALRWVQTHIAAFGGDPDNVTIFGESAGSVSCSLHVLSEVTSGLFRRAILQSGPANIFVTTRTQAAAREKLNEKLAKSDYAGTSNAELVAYLRNKTAEDITTLDPEFRCFIPVIDGVYLRDDPQKLYNEGKFQKVEIITGSCSHEGYFGVKNRFSSEEFKATEEEIRKTIAQEVSPYFPKNTEVIVDVLFKFFMADGAVGNVDKFKQRYTDMLSDLTFFLPNNRLALAHSVKAPVYMYEYSYRSSMVTEEDWLDAEHGADVFAMFGGPFTNSFADYKDDATDRIVSRNMMAFWANFAKTGDPNGDGLPKWPRITQEDQTYMILDKECKEAKDFQRSRIEYWETEILPLDTSRK